MTQDAIEHQRFNHRMAVNNALFRKAREAIDALLDDESVSTSVAVSNAEALAEFLKSRTLKLEMSVAKE